jgi:signal transduction histidine kinase
MEKASPSAVLFPINRSGEVATNKQISALPRILIYCPAEVADLFDHSFLEGTGYEVTQISHPQAIEACLNTFTGDALLIIVHLSASQALIQSEAIQHLHPNLPIILASGDLNEGNLRHALRLGLVDCLPIPVDAPTMLHSIQRGIDRQNSAQEGKWLNRIFAGLNDGIILEDLSGHLWLLNQAASRIFSITDEASIGKPVSDVFHHPDLLDLLALGGTFPKRREISMEDGHVYGAQASWIEKVGVAVVLQEITHLKELDRIKTDFVNTVSHDLRSPLTAIYGFVGLIDRVGPVNAQQTEFIRHIQASVQHITLLINDLLELGRVEAAHDIQMENVDLKEIILRSVQGLDFQVNEKMQELTLTLPDAVPPILGNPTHLQRMVSNLVENAIKFTPPLGKISVRCRAEVNQLMLEVTDSGYGIPIEDQPHVFDKFYRGSNLSATTQGTGLGLSIVQTVLENHHGRIWLDSSPRGTTFTIILPII